MRHARGICVICGTAVLIFIIVQSINEFYEPKKGTVRVQMSHNEPINTARGRLASYNATDAIRQRLQSRKQWLATVCERHLLERVAVPIAEALGRGGANTLNAILLNDAHKLSMCTIAKVACSNWKRVFLALNGTDFRTDPGSNEYVHGAVGKLTLGRRRPESHEAILREYSNALLVRHPFDRILSAYRDKIEPGEGQYASFGRRIADAFPDKRMRPPNATFEQFVRHLVVTDPAKFDVHWRRYVDQCQPCSIRYDFVVKYEHMSEESDVVFHQLGIGRQVGLSARGEFYKSKPTGELRHHYYSALSPVLVRKLYEKYFDDFYLFGYVFDDSK